MSARAQALVIAMLAACLAAVSFVAFQRDDSDTRATSDALREIRQDIQVSMTRRAEEVRADIEDLHAYVRTRFGQTDEAIAAIDVRPLQEVELVGVGDFAALRDDLDDLLYDFGILSNRVTGFHNSLAETFREGEPERDERWCPEIEDGHEEVVDQYRYLQSLPDSAEQVLLLVQADVNMLRLEMFSVAYGCDVHETLLRIAGS